MVIFKAFKEFDDITKEVSNRCTADLEDEECNSDPDVSQEIIFDNFPENAAAAQFDLTIILPKHLRCTSNTFNVIVTSDYNYQCITEH